LAYQTIPTRTGDLVRAVTPGLLLNAPLFAILVLTHFAVGDLRTTMPLIYLLVMAFTGALTYLIALLYLPIPAISSEADRWRQKLNGGFKGIRKFFT
jgi:flagellar biosynthesis protein FliR